MSGWRLHPKQKKLVKSKNVSGNGTKLKSSGRGGGLARLRKFTK